MAREDVRDGMGDRAHLFQHKGVAASILVDGEEAGGRIVALSAAMRRGRVSRDFTKTITSLHRGDVMKKSCPLIDNSATLTFILSS